MTDKELLEVAAKATEIYDDMYCETVSGRPLHCEERGLSINAGGWWNPLADDGDALRLAVKLQLLVNIDGDESQATDGKHSEECEIHKFSDPYAATRRAIVRAAAEIGKDM